MSVIANLDINLRGNTANLDTSLTKSSQAVSSFASNVSGSAAAIGGKLAGIGGGFLASMPNGGSLAKMFGAIGQPLTTLKQLGMGVWNALSGVFTLNPVQLIKGLIDLKDGLGNILKSALAIGAAFFAMGMANIGPIAELNKQAQKLGISTEALSGYVHVSRLDLEELSSSMVKLEKHIADAGNGSKEAAAAFAQLGIDAREMLAASPEQHIEALARAFETIPTQAEKIRMSMELFGKSGSNMLKLLGAGPEGLKKGLEEAAALGMVVSGAQAKQVAAAKGAMSKMRESFTGLGRTAAIAIAPFVEMAANAVTKAVSWLNQLREPLLKWFGYVQFIFQNFGEVVSIQFDRALWKVTSWGNSFIHIFTDVLPQVIASFGELLYDGLTSGFAEGFEKAWQKAMRDIHASMQREEGAIERSLREGFEARQKGLNQRWQQFWADKNKAAALGPKGQESPTIGGASKNAAVERGSKEAFEIIAGVQGDKMYTVANKQLDELRRAVKELQELRRKKGKGIGLANL